MKFKLFAKLFDEAREYSDVDMYVAERGWEEWMDEYSTTDSSDMTSDVTEIASILTRIYELAHMDLGQLRTETKLSANAFSRLYGIPTRTMQSWEYKKRRTPDYALRFISYAIFMDELENDSHE